MTVAGIKKGQYSEARSLANVCVGHIKERLVFVFYSKVE